MFWQDENWLYHWLLRGHGQWGIVWRILSFKVSVREQWPQSQKLFRENAILVSALHNDVCSLECGVTCVYMCAFVYLLWFSNSNIIYLQIRSAGSGTHKQCGQSDVTRWRYIWHIHGYWHGYTLLTCRMRKKTQIYIMIQDHGYIISKARDNMYENTCRRSLPVLFCFVV